MSFLTPVPLELCILPTWFLRAWNREPPRTRSLTLMARGVGRLAVLGESGSGVDNAMQIE